MTSQLSTRKPNSNGALGALQVEPQEICILPRGLVYVFSVQLVSPASDSSSSSPPPSSSLARGYVLEIYKGHFELPELGPIGSNGLANARDFLHPTAYCVTDQDAYHTPCQMLQKFNQQLFTKSSSHSPLNVVAWHGNYLPFKYDLRNFCAVNSVTYDHLDPSIYTVLTCVEGPGTALADFVIPPPPSHHGHRCQYLSTAVVPSQHHDGIHGTDLWNVRCQIIQWIPTGRCLVFDELHDKLPSHQTKYLAKQLLRWHIGGRFGKSALILDVLGSTTEEEKAIQSKYQLPPKEEEGKEEEEDEPTKEGVVEMQDITSTTAVAKNQHPIIIKTHGSLP